LSENKFKPPMISIYAFLDVLPPIQNLNAEVLLTAKKAYDIF